MKKRIKILFYLQILLIVTYNSFAQDKAKIDSLENLLKAAVEDSNKVLYLTQLSGLHINKNPDKALKYGENALTLAKKINYITGMIESLNSIGHIYAMQGYYDKAMSYYNTVTKINIETDRNKIDLARNLNNIANLLLKQGKFEKALEYYLLDLEAFKKIGDQKGISASLHNIGEVYISMKEYDRAFDYFMQSLNIDEEINDKWGISDNYLSIGHVYSFQNKQHQSLDYYFKSLEIFEILLDKQRIAFNLLGISEVYFMLKEYKKAVKFSKKGLSISKEIGAKSEIKKAYCLLVKIHKRQNHKIRIRKYTRICNKMNNILNNNLNINLIEIERNQDTCLTREEYVLYQLITEYRQQKGLPEIPLSKSLTKVAKIHVNDMHFNRPFSKKCNMHSWSKKGNWTSCCYTDDHKQKECMWIKPNEIADYKNYGYEIAHGYYKDKKFKGNVVTAEKALKGWKSSYGHNTVIINKGKWKDIQWKAIGIGIYKDFAVVWFGETEDNKGKPTICK